jgi:hypothetical protein
VLLTAGDRKIKISVGDVRLSKETQKNVAGN